MTASDAVANDEAGEPLGNDSQATASAFSFVSSFEGYQPATSVPAKPAGQVVEHDVDGVSFADLGNVVVAPSDGACPT